MGFRSCARAFTRGRKKNRTDGNTVRRTDVRKTTCTRCNLPPYRTPNVFGVDGIVIESIKFIHDIAQCACTVFFALELRENARCTYVYGDVSPVKRPCVRFTKVVPDGPTGCSSLPPRETSDERGFPQTNVTRCVRLVLDTFCSRGIRPKTPGA